VLNCRLADEMRNQCARSVVSSETVACHRAVNENRRPERVLVLKFCLQLPKRMYNPRNRVEGCKVVQVTTSFQPGLTAI
jgi:hypothetical protein